MNHLGTIAVPPSANPTGNRLHYPLLALQQRNPLNEARCCLTSHVDSHAGLMLGQMHLCRHQTVEELLTCGQRADRVLL